MQQLHGQGLITGVKNGKANITATTANGKSDTCVVTVQTSPTNIILDNQNITLNLSGTKTITLQPSMVPLTANINTAVTWKSSNEAVAKVSEEGLVTAVGEGNATITVTTENNKQATCVVNVLEKETQIVRPESIQLNSTQETLDINGNNKKQLNVNYLPSNSNTDTSITWSSSDNSIVTVTRTRINNRSKKWKG